MSTFYDDLDQFSDYLVTIRNSRTGQVIQGLLDDEEVSYTAAASIGSSTLAGVGEGLIKGSAKAIVGRVAGDLGKNLVSDNFKTVMSTYQGYEDSEHSGFNLNMHIFQNKYGNGSYNSYIEKLGRLTQPNTEDESFLRSYLYAPDDVKKLASGEDPFKGQLIHVSIGRWFLATGLFMKSAPPTFSSITDENGAPIYSVLNAEFVSYKVLNAKEWASWYRK